MPNMSITLIVQGLNVVHLALRLGSGAAISESGWFAEVAHMGFTSDRSLGFVLSYPVRTRAMKPCGATDTD